jgi:hypothetical protein
MLATQPTSHRLYRRGWALLWSASSGALTGPAQFLSTRRVAGVFTAALLGTLARWLLPQPIGAADNGDGWRMLCHLGGNEPDRISERWVRMAYRPSPDCHSGYVSSQEWVDRVAQWIGHELGSAAAFNLYVLGGLSCVLIAGAVTAMAAAVQLPTGGRLAVAALTWLVLADSAVFGWFVSVLSEPAAFLGVTLTAAGLLALERPDRWRYAGAALTTLGAIAAVNAKAQTLLLLPAVVVALLLARKTGRTLAARWALPVLVLACTSAATWVIQTSGDPAGEEYRQINAYHVIFDSIIDGHHDAASDLTALGLPASFAQYQGSNWWGDRPAHADPLWPQYQDRVNMRAVANWYLEHPGRTLGILHNGAKELLAARPDNIGSYVEGSGQPAKAQEYRIPILSGITALLAPLGLFALVPIWVLTAAAMLWGWWRRRQLAVVVAFLLTSAVSQFALAALGEGIEGVKHQLIALFCTLLGAVLAGVLPALRADVLDDQLPKVVAGAADVDGARPQYHR